MSRPSPPIFGRLAQGCWASSTLTSSPWVRRTKPAISAMSFRLGVAMMVATPRLRRVAHRAVRPLQSPHGCALLLQVPTPADPSANQRHLWALAVSSQLMAAARAGALWHSPVRLTKLAQWRATSAIVRSCWRPWQALIQRIRPRSICLSLHGKQL